MIGFQGLTVHMHRRIDDVQGCHLGAIDGFRPIIIGRERRRSSTRKPSAQTLCSASARVSGFGDHRTRRDLRSTNQEPRFGSDRQVSFGTTISQHDRYPWQGLYRKARTGCLALPKSASADSASSSTQQAAEQEELTFLLESSRDSILRCLEPSRTQSSTTICGELQSMSSNSDTARRPTHAAICPLVPAPGPGGHPATGFGAEEGPAAADTAAAAPTAETSAAAAPPPRAKPRSPKTPSPNSSPTVAGRCKWVALSICAIAIILERLVNLNRGIAPGGLIGRVDEPMAQGHYEAGALARSDGSVLGQVLAHCADNPGPWPRSTKAPAISPRASCAAICRPTTGWPWSPPVAAVGLLGTILGMIKAFDVVAVAGDIGDISLVAEGISQALVTTATGLIVAVPALGFFHIFKVRTNKLAIALEEASAAINSWFKSRPTLITRA